MMDPHEGGPNDFRIALLSKHRGCLSRQVEEAVHFGGLLETVEMKCVTKICFHNN